MSSETLNRYSRNITQNDSLPAARAMLFALGLGEEDIAKAQVGIMSAGYEGNPCNMHLNGLATLIKRHVGKQELNGLVFNTIGVSDGMSMGTPGMRYSLPSREIIADSIETVVQAQHYDSLVSVVGCDKNIPGAMIAAARLNRPTIIVYGGTIAPGCYKGKDLNIVSAFEALGEKLSGKISEEDFHGVIRNACPGPGACGGMYTANTMAVAVEAMGMSLPYSSSNPASGTEKIGECRMIGPAIRKLMELNLCPLDIMNRKSFENAIVMCIVMGGSTNLVLHMLAIARTAGIELSIDDFDLISRRTPYLADLKPSGKYLMMDLHKAGGTPAVMKYLLDNGMLHGDCITVTGKTIAENLEDVTPMGAGQKVLMPLSKPLKSDGHLCILKGNLAPNGCVAKITGKEGNFFEGKARVFNSEDEANEAITGNLIQKGDVIVIRYVGPKGGPGMPEMLKPTSAIMGAGLGKDVALITDGRFSGGSHGFVVGHICPEAYEGGVIALLEDGDLIRIDTENRMIEALINEGELTKRKENWTRPSPPALNGYLYKFMKTVSGASEGCTTDQF